MTAPTFFWHDYETWGIDTARDRPVQFAGVRTDAEFNVIDEPVDLMCRPTPDYLPAPEACLVTGLTPQQALDEGMAEAEFIQRVHAELAAPGTCGVGYNSLRFDDEVTRNTLYRNFYDPYAREWQHGNSRWDLIDLVRLCHALRPDGMHWPQRDDGRTSFRLEELTAANDLAHESAHDAMSDVWATLALAQRIRALQPRMVDYAMGLRFRHEAARHLNLATQAPVLYISGQIPGAQQHAGFMMPLMAHPTRRHSIIAVDLRQDPSALLGLDADGIRARLFVSQAELPDGVERLALREIHLNRAPMMVPAKMVDDAVAARLGIDLPGCRQHWRQLREAREALAATLNQVYGAPAAQRPGSDDPDLMLYSGGFFSDDDRARMEAVRHAAPNQLGQFAGSFQDERLDEMLWRYRARNFPETLAPRERQRWQQWCHRRLTHPADGERGLAEFHQRISALRAELGDPNQHGRAHWVLDELDEYGQALHAAINAPVV